jgi:hypothetical protein
MVSMACILEGTLSIMPGLHSPCAFARSVHVYYACQISDMKSGKTDQAVISEYISPLVLRYFFAHFPCVIYSDL